MGQRVTVIEKPSARPDTVRYETNRVLSGMGHERFVDAAAITGHRPVDEVARRLLGTGRVQAVHVNANVITVSLAPGATAAGLRDIVEDLYTYYRPGVEVPSFEAPAEAPAEA